MAEVKAYAMASSEASPGWVVLWPTETEAVAPPGPDRVEAPKPRDPSYCQHQNTHELSFCHARNRVALTAEGSLGGSAESGGEESSETGTDFL